MSMNQEGSEDFTSNMSRFTRRDYKPEPFTANVMQEAIKNPYFRKEFWTGNCVQMTLMSIQPCGEIGTEIHSDTDQIIRVEQGQAVVAAGRSKDNLNDRKRLCKGDVVFIPACTWHNIYNISRCPLKLSSIYAPPKHKRGTIHKTKEDADKSSYS